VSGAKILIVESNPPDLIAAQGYRACDQFKAAFAELEPSVKCRVAEPYATKFQLEKLDDIDGVVFTGSGVNWSVDAKEAAPLREVMEHVFQSDLPVWGSCNGMQLAAVVLGGSVRPSPNGLEVGVARDTCKTEAGKSHPALDGRTDVYAVPCIHRDEVERLPKGAVLLAENDHSPVQSFSYRAEGVDFWGAQYHPECSATSIAKSLRAGNGVFSAQTALIDDLEAGERDARAAERLGTTCAALHPKERTRELANWLMHVKDRISS
jgi:GMP synthase (glutamine-hydrolysing)